MKKDKLTKKEEEIFSEELLDDFQMMEVFAGATAFNLVCGCIINASKCNNCEKPPSDPIL